LFGKARTIELGFTPTRMKHHNKNTNTQPANITKILRNLKFHHWHLIQVKVTMVKPEKKP